MKCRLFSVMRGGDAPKEFRVDTGRGKSPLVITPARSMRVAAVEVPVSREGVLRFVEGEGAEATVVGETKVPAGAGELNLFAMPDTTPDDAVLYQFAAFDAKPKELKNGGVAFFNGLTSEAKLTVGEKTETVPAGEPKLVKSPEEKNNFNMAPVIVEVNDGTRLRKVKESASRFSGDETYWLILFEEPKVKRPQLRIFK